MAVPKGGIASMLGGMSPGMGRGFADGGFVDARMANPMMGGTGMAAPYGDTPMGQPMGDMRGAMGGMTQQALSNQLQGQAALGMYNQLQGQGMGQPNPFEGRPAGMIGAMGGMPQPAGQMMPRGGLFAPPLYPQGAMDYQPRGPGMPQGGMGNPAMGGGMPKPIPPMGRSELKRAGLYTKPGAAPMPQGQGIQPQSVGIAGALPPGMMPFR